MLLVADSGSTKTAWQLVQTSSNHTDICYTTNGLNPFVLTTEQIKNEVTSHLPKEANEVKYLFFYGAGCADEARRQIMKSALQPLFPNAIIQIESDLLGAARAMCKHQPGIICILGTGANSALYDGEYIVDQILPLGYQLGDEGSGANLGKRLLQHFFYRELPQRLNKKLKLLLPNGRSDVLNALKSDKPNVWLAHWTHFIADNIQSEPKIKRMVVTAFEEFLSRQVAKYHGANSLPIHFVGSVAKVFEPILTELLLSKKMQKGFISNQIIGDLADYHRG